ncbi:hypothetical protein C8R43DRAFT_947200 [Mycena crocata]|nr:hypothetical protein C8R43DRAFT_947200 [Mycena crocata]
MVGQAQKKRKRSVDTKYRRKGRRTRSISDIRGSAIGQIFFFIPELIVEELLYYCDLFTLMTVSKTCEYARDLVKAFFNTNLRLLVSLFVSDVHVKEFYEILDFSRSAMGGSVVTSVLSFPYRHTWTPYNLNILIPRGRTAPWIEFLKRIALTKLPKSLQTGVDLRFENFAHSHVIYYSKIADLTIHLTESITGSVLTPVIGSTSTFDTNIATAADLYSLYTFMLQHRRALEGWYPTPVLKAVEMGKRGFRSSFSTTSWNRPCGLHCPLLYRSLNNFKNIGVFRWGGPTNEFADNSLDGVPYIDEDMVWRLGDICHNPNCKAYKGSYTAFQRDD